MIGLLGLPDEALMLVLAYAATDVSPDAACGGGVPAPSKEGVLQLMLVCKYFMHLLASRYFSRLYLDASLAFCCEHLVHVTVDENDLFEERGSIPLPFAPLVISLQVGVMHVSVLWVVFACNSTHPAGVWGAARTLARDGMSHL